MDPPLTSDGRPYAPERVNELIKQAYLISRQIHTSYNDILEMSPMERETMLRIISEEVKLQNDAKDKASKQNKKKKR